MAARVLQIERGMLTSFAYVPLTDGAHHATLVIYQSWPSPDRIERMRSRTSNSI